MDTRGRRAAGIGRLVRAVLAVAWSAYAATSWGAARVDLLVPGKITSSGAQRSFGAFATESCKSAASPCAVVFGFHGGGGQYPGFDHMAHLSEALTRAPWKDRAILLIEPNATDKHWNDGRPEIAPDIPDLQFVDDLLAWAAANYKVDRERVFATGISNGGFFSFRVACERAAVFKAVAPVAATLSQALAATCKPERPVALLNVMGDQDPLVPYAGGEVRLPVPGAKGRGAVLSAEATAQFWSKLNDCANFATSTTADSRLDRTVIEVRTGKCTGAPLAQWVVHGGGHAWPGGEQYMRPIFIGTASRQLNATDEILKFFLGE